MLELAQEVEKGDLGGPGATRINPQLSSSVAQAVWQQSNGLLALTLTGPSGEEAVGRLQPV